MKALQKMAALCALCGALGIGAAPALAGGLNFTTSSGIRLSLPPINQLNCQQMPQVLAQIDATGYREATPTPQNPADAPLYRYEAELANVFYKRCVLRNAQNQASGQLMRIRR